MCGYMTFHPVRNQDKLVELTASMQRNGWQGAPLVADGEQFITGAHRYPAALAAGIEPEIIDIRDIYPEWVALHAEYGYPTVDSYDYVRALADLPATLREAYGIDAH